MAFNTSTSTGARRREPRHNEGSGRGTRDSAEVVLLIVAVVVAFAAAAGCADPVEATYPDPTSANVATVRGGIEAVVVRPDTTGTLGTPRAEIEIAAYVPGGPGIELSAELRLEDRLTVPMDATGPPGTARRFTAEVGLVHGANAMAVVIQDESGRFRHTLDLAVRYGGGLPGLRISGLREVSGGDCTDVVVERYTRDVVVCVVGRASVQVGPVGVSATGDAGKVVGLVRQGRFALVVPLVIDAVNEIEVTAVSERGLETMASTVAVQDSTPPIVAIREPADGERTAAPDILVSGQWIDVNGVAELRVESSVGAPIALPVVEFFDVLVPLAPGENAVSVIATDVAGNVGRDERDVIRDRVVTLRGPRFDATTEIDLDRYALEALLTEEDRQAIELLRLELRPAIVAALRAIGDPSSHGVDTASWGTPEWNMWRLLNMTPDTADLRGTSLERMLAIGDAVGLPGPRLLAEIHDIAHTEVFLDVETLADVALEHLIGSHPNTERDGAGRVTVRVSLDDALRDMRPIGVRYGPNDGHPGFIDGETYAPTLEPAFLMSLSAESTLTEFDGLDLSTGTKDFMYRGDDTPAVRLDFDDPDTFAVVGLVDEPEMTLRFVIQESGRFFEAGRTRSYRPAEEAGFFLGDGDAWGASPWLLERFVAEAAYARYHDAWADSGFRQTFTYDAGSIEDIARIEWDRGWVEITTAGGLGDPPPPAYVWDTLVEIAQVRLHDGGLEEGDANLAFELTVPIGFTADELIASLRPSLEAQAETIAERLVGAGVRVVPRADIFVDTARSGALVLFFRAPEDTPEIAYPYERPGFYADEDLSDLRSTVDPLAGHDDRLHHKVAPAVGDVYFAADEVGDVFRIEIVGFDAAGLDVRVTTR